MNNFKFLIGLAGAAILFLSLIAVKSDYASIPIVSFLSICLSLVGGGVVVWWAFQLRRAKSDARVDL